MTASLSKAEVAQKSPNGRTLAPLDTYKPTLEQIRNFLATLDKNLGDYVVVLDACKALHITAASDTSRCFLVDAGGVEAVVKALGSVPGDAQVQCAGLKTLRALDGCGQHSQDIVAGGGLAAAVSAMKLFPLVPAVQQLGIDLICHIARYSCKAIARENAIEVVHASLVAHPDDAFLFQSGSEIYALVAQQCERCRSQLLGVGCVRILRSAMHRWADNAALLEHILCCFEHLSLEERLGGPYVVADDCGLTMITSTMQTHRRHVNLQVHSCGILEHIILYASTAHAESAVLVGFGEVVEALQAHKRHSILRKACFKYINTAFERFPAAAEQTFRCCSTHALITTMVLFATLKNHSSGRPQQVGCEAIRDLGLGPQRQMIVKNGALEAVCTAIRQNPTHAGLQRAGLEALASLTSGDHLSGARAVEAGGVELAVTALRNHTVYPWVLRSACEALLRTIDSRSDAAQRALQVRCLEAIEVAQRLHYENPQLKDLCHQVSGILRSQAVRVY